MVGAWNDDCINETSGLNGRISHFLGLIVHVPWDFLTFS